MSKKIERELKSVDSGMLYKPKGNKSSEPVLLGTMKTTELIDNPSVTPVTATPIKNEPTKLTESLSKAPQNSPQEEKDQNKFPRSAPYISVPPSLLSNQQTNGDQPPNKDNNNDKKQGGKSVIVDLSPTGNSAPEKKRLSRIIEEVEKMKKVRKQRDIFDSQLSLDEKMERTNQLIQRRLDKIRRSKQLMFKYQIYEFLKRPSTFWSTFYHVVAFVLVMACLIVSIFPQMDQQLEDWGGKWVILDILEKLVVIWFTIEYLARLWSCDCRPKYQGCNGKWNFIKAPAHLIDLFVIILSILVMVWPHEGHEVFAFRAFRGFHRFFQVVQIVMTERQLRPWRLFLSVLYDQREQLMVIFYLEIIIFALLAYLGFIVEHQSNDMLDTIAEGVWWSIVTLTTVGYGDKVPITWRGKIITAIFIMFGFCVFALPAGIIGAGLALKLEQVEQSRQRRKKIDAAARVIQAAWHYSRDHQACQQMSSFFSHQTGDIYKTRLMENISQSFISLIRFQVAKSEFKKLTKSVNLRNVIESYKYGQMDIFERLNKLNQTLDYVMNKIAKSEHERSQALKRLTNQLGGGGGSDEDGDMLVHTDDGSYFINTVSGSLQQPEITFIPRGNSNQKQDVDISRNGAGGKPTNQTGQQIPFIDSAEAEASTQDEDKNGSSDELRHRGSRRHSE